MAVGSEAAQGFGRRQQGEMDGGDGHRVCLFWGDVLSRSHLHAVRCNKEIRSDDAGSFISIPAPASAVRSSEMRRHLLLAVAY